MPKNIEQSTETIGMVVACKEDDDLTLFKERLKEHALEHPTKHFTLQFVRQTGIQSKKDRENEIIFNNKLPCDEKCVDCKDGKLVITNYAGYTIYTNMQNANPYYHSKFRIDPIKKINIMNQEDSDVITCILKSRRAIISSGKGDEDYLYFNGIINNAILFVELNEFEVLLLTGSKNKYTVIKYDKRAKKNYKNRVVERKTCDYTYAFPGLNRKKGNIIDAHRCGDKIFISYSDSVVLEYKKSIENQIHDLITLTKSKSNKNKEEVYSDLYRLAKHRFERNRSIQNHTTKCVLSPDYAFIKDHRNKDRDKRIKKVFEELESRVKNDMVEYGCSDLNNLLRTCIFGEIIYLFYQDECIQYNTQNNTEETRDIRDIIVHGSNEISLDDNSSFLKKYDDDDSFILVEDHYITRFQWADNVPSNKDSTRPPKAVYNIGALYNIGAKCLMKDLSKLLKKKQKFSINDIPLSHFVFTDCKILPDDTLFTDYIRKHDVPISFSSREFESVKGEKKIGRVLSMNKDYFLTINGYSNTFWGKGEGEKILQSLSKLKQLEHRCYCEPDKGIFTELEEDDRDNDALKDLKLSIGYQSYEEKRKQTKKNLKELEERKNNGLFEVDDMIISQETKKNEEIDNLLLKETVVELSRKAEEIPRSRLGGETRKHRKSFVTKLSLK
jgi:hypothetical protein